MAEKYTAKLEPNGDCWAVKVYGEGRPDWLIGAAGHTRGEAIRWAARGLMARLGLGPKDRLPWRVEEVPFTPAAKAG